MSRWHDAARREQPVEMTIRERKSVIRDDSCRKDGSLGSLAAIALHGSQKVRNDDATFVQHLSTSVARHAPPAKLDTVRFDLFDRVSAWLTGTGTDLRRLKELHLSDAPTADGMPARKSTIVTLKRRSLVLLGAEERAISRDEREGNFGRGPPGLVAGLVDLQLRAHVDASVYGMSRSQTATADEITTQMQDFLPAYPLTFFERLYLRLSGEFSEDDKDILLGRVPAVAIANAHRQRRQQDTDGARLSVRDIFRSAPAPAGIKKRRQADAAEIEVSHISASVAQSDCHDVSATMEPASQAAGQTETHSQTSSLPGGGDLASLLPASDSTAFRV